MKERERKKSLTRAVSSRKGGRGQEKKKKVGTLKNEARHILPRRGRVEILKSSNKRAPTKNYATVLEHNPKL